MNKLLIAVAATLALAGCAVQPASHNDLPDTVSNVAPQSWAVDVPPSPIDARAWWAQFNDPTLKALIDTVLTGNLDLQAAGERVRQAQSFVIQKHAQLIPQLDAVGGVSAQRKSIPPPLGYVRQGGIGLALSWSPDVFGGERLELLAAQSELLGREHAEDAIRLALAADTAGAYVELRWAQTELQILNDNVGIRERALVLTRKRLAAGLSTQLDVSRAQNQLDALRAKIEPTKSAVRHQLDLLAVYSGLAPKAVEDMALTTAAPIPAPGVEAPAMLPSEALLRRPDVLMAYARVEQRAAQVGVARAERYPKFSFSLSDGLLAATYLGAPTVTDNLFSAALNATSPIFNAGRITADIEQSESRLRESQLQLHQTMLQALRQVEDSRTDLVSTEDQRMRLDIALQASQQSLKLANELYRGGATDFLDVLAAQEVYLRDSESLVQAKRDHALSAVALYRSLGGGWSTKTAPTQLADTRPQSPHGTSSD